MVDGLPSREKSSGAERLQWLVEQDVGEALSWIEAVGDLVAFGDIDEYEMLVDVPQGDEEARVRGQAHAAIWSIYFQVLEQSLAKEVTDDG